jgi:ectoine hydroxylase-related dioxygenase (phytanoyl-CoA dioxygenase family)
MTESDIESAIAEMRYGSGVHVVRNVFSTDVCLEVSEVIQSYEPDQYGNVRCLLDKSIHIESLVQNPEIIMICDRLFKSPCRLSSFGARVIDPDDQDNKVHRRVSGPHIDHPYREIIGATEGEDCPLYDIPLGTQVLMPFMDLTVETGATAYVPGSQLWYRHPTAEAFSREEAAGNVKRLELSLGDLAMWSGPLWHMAMPNYTRRQRVIMTFLYSPKFMKHPHLMREMYDPEYLSSLPEKLQNLINLDDDVPAIYAQPARISHEVSVD